MGIFGGKVGDQGLTKQRDAGLGSVMPDGRYDAAERELRAAEAAYGAAESRLIKARRSHEDALREWQRFYYPSQSTQ